MNMTEDLDKSRQESAKPGDDMPEQRDDIPQGGGASPDDPLAELIRLVKQEDPFAQTRPQQTGVQAPEPGAPQPAPSRSGAFKVAPVIEPDVPPRPPAPETVPDPSLPPEPQVDQFVMDESSKPDTPTGPAVAPEPQPSVPDVAPDRIPAAMPQSRATPPQPAQSEPQPAKGEPESFVPPVLEVRPPERRPAAPEPAEPAPQPQAPEPVQQVAPDLAIGPDDPFAPPMPGGERIEPHFQSADTNPDVHSDMEPLDLEEALRSVRTDETLAPERYTNADYEPETQNYMSPPEPAYPSSDMPVDVPFEPAAQQDLAGDPYTHANNDLGPAVGYEDQAPGHAGTPYDDPAFADDPNPYDSNVAGNGAPAYAGMPAQENVFQDGVTRAAVEEPLQPPHAAAEDEDPRRRRGAVFAVGLLLTLAVVGGSLAFAFIGDGGEGSDTPPPLVRADSEPAKVAPDDPGGQSVQHQNSLVYEGNNGGEAAGNERLVSREESIVNVPKVTPKDTTRPGTSATLPAPLQPGQPESPPTTRIASAPQDANSAAAPGGNVSGSVNVAPAPRKVRTVIVRPDGTVVSQPSASSSQTTSSPGVSTLPATTAPAQAATSPSQPSIPIPTARPPQPRDSQPRPATTQVASQPQTTAPTRTQSSNAPISLTPPSSGQTQTARNTAPQTTAPAPQNTAPATQSGQFVVQVAARRSEAQAQAAFSQLRSNYGSQVSNYRPLIQRADLGDRGVYYRLRVGPMNSHDEATRVCSNLKAAGLSDCLVKPR